MTRPAVVLARPASYPVTDAVVEEALERFAPPLEGRRVLVKPNCLAGLPPGRAVTTHPSLLAAVVRALRRRGARVTTGDNPGARDYGSSRRCFGLSGLLEAAGGTFEDIGGRTATVDLRSRIAPRAVVSAALLEADYVVTLPKMKTHCLTLITGAVKNHYGLLAGAEKARLHYAARTPGRFAELLADLLALRPPDLAIMDAVVAMEGDGPTHGSPRAVGLVLASDDPVAVDAVAARVAGVPPRRVAHLRAAAARGLGAVDAADIRVDGEARPVPGFRTPSNLRAGVLAALSGLVVFNLLHRSRLEVDVRKCRRCGACERACPSGAMGRRGGAFVIDASRCLHCYCCSELCPAGAVRARGALGALMGR